MLMFNGLLAARQKLPVVFNDSKIILPKLTSLMLAACSLPKIRNSITAKSKLLYKTT